jgi:hypothetical protein
MGGLTALPHQEGQARILGMENHPIPVLPKLPEAKQGEGRGSLSWHTVRRREGVEQTVEALSMSRSEALQNPHGISFCFSVEALSIYQ